MRLLGQYILIALVTLILAETGARLFLPQPGLQPLPPNQPPQLLVENPVRSYAYRPGFSGKVYETLYAIDVTINELGMRDGPVKPGEHIDVLAVGDSFTDGYMIQADEAWPARLQHYLQKATPGSHVRVLNGGVSGYSLKQIRLAARDYASVRPDIVVAGVLPAVADRLVNPYQWFEGYAVRAEKIPYLKKTDTGFLTALPGSRISPKVQFWLMENFRVGATLWLAIANRQIPGVPLAEATNYDPEELLNKLLIELGELDELTRSNDQQFVVLLVGFQRPDGSFGEALKMQNKRVIEYCDQHHIPVFDPVPQLEAKSKEPVFRITPADYHWTPLAHDIVAEGLSRYLATLKPATAG